MSFKSLLNLTCTIQTVTIDYTANADGTPSETWADTYEDVACRINSLSGAQLEEIRGYNLESTHVIFLQSDETVSEGNRIVISSDTYLVEYIKPLYNNDSLHHYEVFIRKFEGS